MLVMYVRLNCTWPGLCVGYPVLVALAVMIPQENLEVPLINVQVSKSSFRAKWDICPLVCKNVWCFERLERILSVLQKQWGQTNSLFESRFTFFPLQSSRSIWNTRFFCPHMLLLVLDGLYRHPTQTHGIFFFCFYLQSNKMFTTNRQGVSLEK